MLSKIAALISLSCFAMGNAAAAQPATLADCISACSQKTPDCLAVSPPSGSGLSASFSRLYSVVSKGAGTITSNDLRTMFGGISDPCGRSATTLDANSLQNSGQSCLLTQQIEFPGTSVTVEVLIPEELRALYSIQVGEVRLKFRQHSNAALLMIGNKFLNIDWGGVITDISFREEHSIFLTANGASTACLQFIYGG